jgi:hypothetical protein
MEEYMCSFPYPYMILVVTLNNRIPEEIIIGCQVLPLASSPVHILLFPSKAVVIVCQAQYELDPIPPGLGYNKIQALQTTKKRTRKTKIINILKFKDLKKGENGKE